MQHPAIVGYSEPQLPDILAVLVIIAGSDICGKTLISAATTKVGGTSTKEVQPRSTGQFPCPTPHQMLPERHLILHSSDIPVGGADPMG